MVSILFYILWQNAFPIFTKWHTITVTEIYSLMARFVTAPWPVISYHINNLHSICITYILLNPMGLGHDRLPFPMFSPFLFKIHVYDPCLATIWRNNLWNILILVKTVQEVYSEISKAYSPGYLEIKKGWGSEYCSTFVPPRCIFNYSHLFQTARFAKVLVISLLASWISTSVGILLEVLKHQPCTTRLNGLIGWHLSRGVGRCSLHKSLVCLIKTITQYWSVSMTRKRRLT